MSTIILRVKTFANLLLNFFYYDSMNNYVTKYLAQLSKMFFWMKITQINMDQILWKIPHINAALFKGKLF